MSIDYKVILAAAGAFLVIGWVLREQVKQGAAAVGGAVNPVSRENIFYKSANSFFGVFGDGEGTIGTDIYDLLHK